VDCVKVGVRVTLITGVEEGSIGDGVCVIEVVTVGFLKMANQGVAVCVFV